MSTTTNKSSSVVNSNLKTINSDIEHLVKTKPHLTKIGEFFRESCKRIYMSYTVSSKESSPTICMLYEELRFYDFINGEFYFDGEYLYIPYNILLAEVL